VVDTWAIGWIVRRYNQVQGAVHQDTLFKAISRDGFKNAYLSTFRNGKILAVVRALALVPVLVAYGPFAADMPHGIRISGEPPPGLCTSFVSSWAGSVCSACSALVGIYVRMDPTGFKNGIGKLHLELNRRMLRSWLTIAGPLW
jgi:hypothetical protein